MSTLGLIHVVFGLLALLTGTLVLFIRKGTRYHRTLGHWYFACMLGLNVTALLIYRLTGKFNFFHVAALFSLAFLVVGLSTVIFLRPRKVWVERHAYFMTGSYIGLLAAAAAEVTTRVPGWPLGLTAGLTSAIIIFGGVYLMTRRMPFTLERFQPRQRVRREESRG